MPRINSPPRSATACSRRWTLPELRRGRTGPRGSTSMSRSAWRRFMRDSPPPATARPRCFRTSKPDAAPKSTSSTEPLFASVPSSESTCRSTVQWLLSSPATNRQRASLNDSRPVTAPAHLPAAIERSKPNEGAFTGGLSASAGGRAVRAFATAARSSRASRIGRLQRWHVRHARPRSRPQTSTWERSGSSTASPAQPCPAAFSTPARPTS